MEGKLIVIEGTDCSGKQTQSELLIERLREDGIKVSKFSFPNYNSPTGKIVGGPYLGKDYICEGWFSETAPNVDPKVSALYFAADRKYNIATIINQLRNGENVILDRYVYSNMAHQGCKFREASSRNAMYQWLEDLEFHLLELPEADIKVFLHMPYEASVRLKEGRIEKADQNEASAEHLINAENSYMEIAKKYGFYTIECCEKKEIKSIEEINEALYQYVKEQLLVLQKNCE